MIGDWAPAPQRLWESAAMISVAHGPIQVGWPRHHVLSARWVGASVQSASRYDPFRRVPGSADSSRGLTPGREDQAVAIRGRSRFRDVSRGAQPTR